MEDPGAHAKRQVCESKQWHPQNIFIGGGGQMGPVKILGWHTKMVLLVATQIQLQSVAVYCIPLDSFSLKR